MADSCTIKIGFLGALRLCMLVVVDPESFVEEKTRTGNSRYHHPARIRNIKKGQAMVFWIQMDAPDNMIQFPGEREQLQRFLERKFARVRQQFDGIDSRVDGVVGRADRLVSAMDRMANSYHDTPYTLDR